MAPDSTSDRTRVSWLSRTRQNERLVLVGEFLWPTVVQGVNISHVAHSGGRGERVGNSLRDISRPLK